MNEEFKVGSRVRYKDSENAGVNYHKNGVIYTIRKIDERNRVWFEGQSGPCMLFRLELVDTEHIHADLIRKWISDPARYQVQYKVADVWVSVFSPNWECDMQYRLIEKEKEKVQKWNWCYLDSNNQYAVSSKKYAQKEAEETFGKSLVEKIDSSMELVYNSI